MRLFRRTGAMPRRLGIIPGAFHPPTRAHLALGCAALASDVDEVMFVLPRRQPHKQYEGVDFNSRLEMLITAADQPGFSVGVSDGGLFVEIARECRGAFGDDVELHFLCGRDAAERIVNWNYGRPEAFTEMLAEFGLLVAARMGEYAVPPELSERIRPLPVEDDWGEVSSTEVRRRIAAGEDWRTLVPVPIWELVERNYRTP